MNDSASDNNLSTVPYDSPDRSVLQTGRLDDRSRSTNGLLIAALDSTVCETPNDELSTLPYDQTPCVLIDEQRNDDNDWTVSTLPYDNQDDPSHINRKTILNEGNLSVVFFNSPLTNNPSTFQLFS